MDRDLTPVPLDQTRPESMDQAADLADSLEYDRRKTTEEVRKEVRENFLDNTIRLKKGEKVRIGTGCVDERGDRTVTLDEDVDEEVDVKIDTVAEANTGNPERKLAVIINIPGGGPEFSKDDDIRQYWLISDGQVEVSVHKFCGWGQVIVDRFLKGSPNDPEKGILRVMDSINIALANPEFREEIKKQYSENSEILALFEEDNTQMLYTKAREYVEERSQVVNNPLPAAKETSHTEEEEHPHNNYQELFQQAFVYGKAIKYKGRLIDVHRQMVAEGVQGIPRVEDIQITVKLDDLNGKPHNHIANDAVINLTDRRFTSGFKINGEDPFFADLNSDNVYEVIELIFQIMEGDHSDTAGTKHFVHVFHEDPIKMMEIAKLLDSLVGLRYPNDPTRKIVHHLVDYTPPGLD